MPGGATAAGGTAARRSAAAPRSATVPAAGQAPTTSATTGSDVAGHAATGSSGGTTAAGSTAASAGVAPAPCAAARRHAARPGSRAATTAARIGRSIDRPAVLVRRSDRYAPAPFAGLAVAAAHDSRAVSRQVQRGRHVLADAEGDVTRASTIGLTFFVPRASRRMRAPSASPVG
jgi:hypothetical protein